VITAAHLWYRYGIGPQKNDKKPSFFGFARVAGVAAVVVPAHGYVIGSRGAVSLGLQSIRGPLWKIVNKFFGAVAWMFAISAGLWLVQHFTERWTGAGYPMIFPSVATIAGQQAGNTQPGNRRDGIPNGLGAGSAHRRTQSNDSDLSDIFFSGR